MQACLLLSFGGQGGACGIPKGFCSHLLGDIVFLDTPQPGIVLQLVNACLRLEFGQTYGGVRIVSRKSLLNR